MDGKYTTITAVTEGVFKNKGSKFYAFAHPVNNEEEVKKLVKHYRKKFYDARHHCYAYRLGENGEIFRAADDGEPSNSAGNPILNQIRSRNLSHVFVMVVRYFGGTKLGVPGLIEAYGGSASDALETANTVDKFVLHPLKVYCSYEYLNTVMKAVKTFDLEIENQSYTDRLEIKLQVKKKQFEQVQTALSDFIAED